LQAKHKKQQQNICPEGSGISNQQWQDKQAKYLYISMKNQCIQQLIIRYSFSNL